MFTDLAQKKHRVEERLEAVYRFEHWQSFWTQVLKDWDTSIGNANDLPL